MKMSEYLSASYLFVLPIYEYNYMLCTVGGNNRHHEEESVPVSASAVHKHSLKRTFSVLKLVRTTVGRTERKIYICICYRGLWLRCRRCCCRCSTGIEEIACSS